MESIQMNIYMIKLIKSEMDDILET